MSVAVLPAVSLREALSYWLKLGFVSFGGPAGQISLMHLIVWMTGSLR